MKLGHPKPQTLVGQSLNPLKPLRLEKLARGPVVLNDKSPGLGFRVWGLGFGVWGLGFGVWGLGFRV